MSNGGFKQQLLVSGLEARSGREAIKKPISGFALGDGFWDSNLRYVRLLTSRGAPSPVMGGATTIGRKLHVETTWRRVLPGPPRRVKFGPRAFITARRLAPTCLSPPL